MDDLFQNLGTPRHGTHMRSKPDTDATAAQTATFGAAFELVQAASGDMPVSRPSDMEGRDFGAGSETASDRSRAIAVAMTDAEKAPDSIASDPPGISDAAPVEDADNRSSLATIAGVEQGADLPWGPAVDLAGPKALAERFGDRFGAPGRPTNGAAAFGAGGTSVVGVTFSADQKRPVGSSPTYMKPDRALSPDGLSTSLENSASATQKTAGAVANFSGARGESGQGETNLTGKQSTRQTQAPDPSRQMVQQAADLTARRQGGQELTRSAQSKNGAIPQELPNAQSGIGSVLQDHSRGMSTFRTEGSPSSTNGSTSFAATAADVDTGLGRERKDAVGPQSSKPTAVISSVATGPEQTPVSDGHGPKDGTNRWFLGSPPQMSGMDDSDRVGTGSTAASLQSSSGSEKMIATTGMSKSSVPWTTSLQASAPPAVPPIRQDDVASIRTGGWTIAPNAAAAMVFSAPVPSMMPLAPNQLAVATQADVDGAPLPDLEFTLQTAPIGSTQTVTATPSIIGHASAATAQVIAQQIASALSNGASASDAPLELALDPPELGRLRMQITEIAGVLTLMIHAERPETADLMRRHLELLAQEFAQEGLDAPSVHISQDGANEDNESTQNTGRSEPDPTRLIEKTDAALPQRNRSASGGLGSGPIDFGVEP